MVNVFFYQKKNKKSNTREIGREGGFDIYIYIMFLLYIKYYKHISK